MARAEYQALQPLDINGARGYNPGDEVHAEIVDSQGWIVGEDVDLKDEGQKLLEKPAKNASREKWAAYARDQGVSQDKVDEMGRDDLIAEFEDDNGA